MEHGSVFFFTGNLVFDMKLFVTELGVSTKLKSFDGSNVLAPEGAKTVRLNLDQRLDESI